MKLSTAFLKEKGKNRVSVKLDSRYAGYFPEQSNYSGRPLILLKFVYGMTNSGKLFSDGLTEWLLESGFIKSQLKIYIYYKYARYETKVVLLSYVEYCVYWYISETIGKCFVEILVKIFNVNFLGCACLFMSIKVSHMKVHYISVDQARYANLIVAKYLDNDTVKTSTKFYKTTLRYGMIFTKADASTGIE